MGWFFGNMEAYNNTFFSVTNVSNNDGQISSVLCACLQFNSLKQKENNNLDVKLV